MMGVETRYGLTALRETGMTDQQFAERAALILHHMCLENTGWRSWFRRWRYSDEPLRNDAGNLLSQYGMTFMQPENTRKIGHN